MVKINMEKIIIFLNGVSSSGKTSIIRSIQHLATIPFLTIGIDTLISMLPSDYTNNSKKEETYFHYEQKTQNEFGDLLHIKSGCLNQNIKCLPNLVDVLLKNGNNVIIDEVILSDDYLSDYVKILNQYKVYFIGIICDRKICIEREYLRKNRAVGLANAQFDIVHSGIREYDLVLDSSHKSSFNLAIEVLNYIQKNNNPQSFLTMKRIFDN